MKYVSRTFLEQSDFTNCRDDILRRGETFTTMSQASRSLIASSCHSFIQDGFTVLVHGMYGSSRCRCTTVHILDYTVCCCLHSL
jgi:translation initiation factor 2B subunit (eIF-2B alpha/beta/delta family)